jgi:AcrR family transcriptional regulator
VKRPLLLEAQDLLPAPVQRRSIAKGERLKTAALTLFGEHGYERTSLDDIARRANVAVGGVYLHFRSKRQLVLILMDELLEQLERVDLTPTHPADPQRAIHELLSRAFSADLTYLGAYRAWSEAARCDPALQEFDHQIHRWTNERIGRVFQHLQRMPGARPDVDAGALSRAMDVFFWSHLARAASLRPRELRDWIDTAAHVIYHALFLDPTRASRHDESSTRTSRRPSAARGRNRP